MQQVRARRVGPASVSPKPWASVPERARNASGTAEGACFARAAAARERDRTVANPDYLAKHFVGLYFRTALAVDPVWLVRWLFERKMPGGYAGHTARTRHCDALLQEALVAGTRQFVMLGAGYDTRAYRFESQLTAAHATVFEVDLPSTQARKQRRLRKLYSEPPAHVRYVPIEFTRQSLAEVLLAAGFDPSERTHFTWEGVTYYIDETAISNVLSFVRDYSAGRSSIVFDYWWRSFVEGDYSSYGAAELAHYAVVEQREPFVFGLNREEVAPFLEAHGLQIASDLGAAELTQMYLLRADGRPLGRPWDVMRMCCARI